MLYNISYKGVVFMSKTIYIADDEKNIRDLISTFLKNDGFNVLDFENGDKLLDEFLKNPADMVILDIMMPGTDGLTLCTKIREKSNVPIIIVSARDSELDRITGITLGSDDYLIKPFSPVELVARVKSIFRRLSFETVENNNLSFGNLEINLNTREVKIDNKPFCITPTELALLIYLMQNRDRAISREELLKKVWKFDFDVDTRATDDVIKRLRKKLMTAGCTVKITAVWGFGFRLVVNEE
jgi:DNA-binding response OmpR family regulator